MRLAFFSRVQRRPPSRESKNVLFPVRRYEPLRRRPECNLPIYFLTPLSLSLSRFVVSHSARDTLYLYVETEALAQVLGPTSRASCIFSLFRHRRVSIKIEQCVCPQRIPGDSHVASRSRTPKFREARFVRPFSRGVIHSRRAKRARSCDIGERRSRAVYGNVFPRRDVGATQTRRVYPRPPKG